MPRVLRGPSYWTPGEREYMAVFSSRLNECPFCLRGHTEVTRIESRGEVDIDKVRAAGAPDDAIVDALHVNMIFNTVNRLANAFDWCWDSDHHVRRGAKVIHVLGYKLPGFVMR